MRVVYDVYLAFKIVRIDVNVAAKISDRFNADGCLAVRSYLDDIGASPARDVAAVSARAARKCGSIGVCAILANKSLCKFCRKRVLARAVCTLNDVGVGQIGVVRKQRPRKPRAKLFVTYDLRENLLQRLTSFRYKVIHSILYH